MPRGDAKDLQPNSFTPRVGQVVLMENHVGENVGVTKDGVMVHDFNYKKCQELTHLVPFEKIKGYWDIPESVVSE